MNAGIHQHRDLEFQYIARRIVQKFAILFLFGNTTFI